MKLDDAEAAWLEIVCGRQLARGGGWGFRRGLEEKSDRRRLIAASQEAVRTRYWLSSSRSMWLVKMPEDAAEAVVVSLSIPAIHV